MTESQLIFAQQSLGSSAVQPIASQGPAPAGSVVSAATASGGLQKVAGAAIENPTIVFKDHGGITLNNVTVQSIFWGKSWSDKMAKPITDAIGSILDSPYLSALKEWKNTIGPGKLVGNRLLTKDIELPLEHAEPPQRFSKSDVADLIEELLKLNQIPPPGVDAKEIWYCVFVPADVSNVDGDFGQHSHFPSATKNQVIHYAWVPNIDDWSAIFSHELVESITNPEDDGIFAVCSQDPCEIGDVCAGNFGKVNDVTVQAYRSKSGQCVIPGGVVAPSFRP